mgnify:CR=1 FL=1
MNKQPFVNIVWGDLIEKNIDLPERSVVKKVWYEDERGSLGGYWLNFGAKLPLEEISGKLLIGDKDFFEQMNAEFLFFSFEKKTKKVRIVSDIYGRFPWYFFFDKTRLVMSSDLSLVAGQIKNKTLDWDCAFDALNWTMHGTERSMIREIKQVPAGTMVVLDGETLKFTVTSLIDYQKFLADKLETFDSIEDFREALLWQLEKIIEERLRTVKDENFAVELSSGLDCTLIAYLVNKVMGGGLKAVSGVSKHMELDTNVSIMSEFAKKHGIDLTIVRQDDITPFSTKAGLNHLAKNVYDWGGDDIINFQHQLAKLGVKAKFTGDGGDELYQSGEIDKIGKFLLQQLYFDIVDKVKNGLNIVLTSTAIDYLMDKNRLDARPVYPQIISYSEIRLKRICFGSYWESDVWSIDPFADPRLIRLARSMPRINNNIVSKQELWSGDNKIFVSGQLLAPKGGAEDQSRLYLTRYKDFVLELLNKSVLGKLELININEILSDVTNGNLGKYAENWAASQYLMTVVQLEYYLRTNPEIEIHSLT